MNSGSESSKEFFDLIKSIGESRSKQEEDKIISREMAVLKMREFLIRMIYVEMLGHDASFGHIHGVKMVHRHKLLEKRVGYLAVTLTLHKDHELMLLLVNSIQNDLRSDNFLEVSMALTVVAKLVSAELLPALMPLVVKGLTHPQSIVRKKAVMCMHRFYQLDHSTMSSYKLLLRKILCDKDPCVMGASLVLFDELMRNDANEFKSLVSSFVSILKQITEHRLPREYDYHRMPAPWIQIKLLRILARLGTADKVASEGMYEILHEVLRRADVGINVGYAIVYECVRTITSIYPDPSLIEDAAHCVSRFVASNNHNLKYLGINSLSGIVQINPKYALEHQMTVIDCLEDHDETLKRKTLDLLYNMTNPANVTVIVEKLTAFLKDATDKFLRIDLVTRITQLAEKYAPNSAWYIETMNSVFELGGDLVRHEVAHNLMRLVAEQGEQGSITEDNEDVRIYAVRTYLGMLSSRKKLPSVLIHIIAWIVGEFGHMSPEHSAESILEQLCEVVDRQHIALSSRSWILSGMMKLVPHAKAIPLAVGDVIKRFKLSADVDLQQRAHEFLEITKAMDTMRAVLPDQSHSGDIDVDEELSFLDEYVQEALEAGAAHYEMPDDIGAMPMHSYGDHVSGAHVPDSGNNLKIGEYKQRQVSTVFPVQNAHASNTSSASPVKRSTFMSSAAAGGPWGPDAHTEDDNDNDDRHGGGDGDMGDHAGAHNDTGDMYDVPKQHTQNQQQHQPREHSGSSAHSRPTKKREMTAKEKLAASLFSGFAGTPKQVQPDPTTAAAAAAATTTTTTQESPQYRPQSKHQSVHQTTPQTMPQTTPIDDLIPADVFDSTTVVPSNNTPTDEFDIWAISSPGASVASATAGGASAGAPAVANPQPAALPTQMSSSSSFDPLDDLFGGSSMGVPAAAPSVKLVPTQMDVQGFGARWKGFANETKFCVSPSSISSPEDYMARVQQSVRLFPVKILGREMICAGASTTNNAAVLVHSKLLPSAIEVIVRGADANTNNDIVSVLKSVLM